MNFHNFHVLLPRQPRPGDPAQPGPGQPLGPGRPTNGAPHQSRSLVQSLAEPNTERPPYLLWIGLGAAVIALILLAASWRRKTHSIS